MNDITPYAIGLCCASVCAPKTATIAGITDELNAQHPTGMASDWQLSSDATFKTGGPNPGPCNASKDKLHYLFEC